MPPKKFNPYAFLKPPTKRQKLTHADLMRKQREDQRKQMFIKNELERKMKAEKAAARAATLKRQQQLAYDAIVRRQMEIEKQRAKDKEKDAKKGNNDNNSNNNNNSLKQYKYVPPLKYGNKKSSSSKTHPSRVAAVNERNEKYKKIGLEFKWAKGDGHCFFHSLFKCLRQQYLYVKFEDFLFDIISANQTNDLFEFKRKLTIMANDKYPNENRQVKDEIVEGIVFRYLVQFAIERKFDAMSKSILSPSGRAMGDGSKKDLIKQILWSRSREERAAKLGKNSLADIVGFTEAKRKSLLDGLEKQTSYELFQTGEWIEIYTMAYPVIWLLQESLKGEKNVEFYVINSIRGHRWIEEGSWRRYTLKRYNPGVGSSNNSQRFYKKNSINDIVTNMKIERNENTHHIFMEFSGRVMDNNRLGILGGHFSPLLPLRPNYSIKLERVRAKP